MISIEEMISDAHVTLFARSFVGLVMLMAGVPKLLDISRFVEIVRGYQLLPGRIVNWVGRLLPIWEIVIGLALLANIFRFWAALSALCLFLVFCGAILTNLMRGRSYIPCGCFGVSKDHELSWKLVMRSGFLGGMAVLALPILPSPGDATLLSIPETALTLLIAAAAVEGWWLSGVILDIWRLPNPLDELQQIDTRN